MFNPGQKPTRPIPFQLEIPDKVLECKVKPKDYPSISSVSEMGGYIGQIFYMQIFYM